jgi:hypothetical protein
MECWTDFAITLNLDDILQGEGVDPKIARIKRPALTKIAQAAKHQGFTKLKPAAILHEAKVIEHRHERILLAGGKTLTGPLAARHLAGAERVAAVVCTIGPALEEYAASLNDLALALALDGLGNAAVGVLAQQVCGRLAERAQVEGLTTSAPLSPGEPEWPVEVGQPQIFGLLDPSRVGITLTSGGMMIPKKSISFVVGIGPEMAQTDLCELCNLRERCRYRHA